MVAVLPVILLVKVDSGGPFQCKEPQSSQGTESALAVKFAVGPIRGEAHGTGVGGEEEVLGVSGAFGDQLCFRLHGVG